MNLQIARKILPSLLFILLVARFLFPSFASFSHDETALQALVEKNYVDGSIPTHGLAGSEPVHYGPVPQWIYLAFRAVTADLLATIGLYTALFCLAFFLVGITLRRAHGAAAWPVMLLALSSPWLFVYSRLAWDNSFLALFSAMMFLSVHLISQRQSFLSWILLGLASGAAISTHLMCIPVVGAAGFVSLLSLSHDSAPAGKKAAYVGAAFLSALLINAPYLTYLISEGIKETGPKDRWGDGRQAWWIFLRSTVFVSTWNWKYFLQPFEADFFSWLAPWKASLFKLDILGWILKILVWGSTLSVVWSFCRRRKIEALSAFAILSVFALLLLLQYSDLKIHPHYFIAVWWFPYWALSRLWSRLNHRARAQQAVTLAVAGAFVVNLLLLFEFHRWLHDYRGTRGDFFPTIVGDQLEAALEVCDRAKALNLDRVTVDLSAVRMDAKLFSWLPTRYENCVGLEFGVPERKLEVGARVSADHIKNSGADFVVVYSDARINSAALEVHEGKRR